MKKYFTFKNIFLVLFTILLIILFFQFLIVYTPDSTKYYYLSLIIKGVISWDNWMIVRGFGFPLIISLITSIFGNNVFGLKIGLCIIYLLTCYLGYYYLKNQLSKSNIKIEKVIVYILYIFLIVLNPIVFGYSHTLLTEIVIPPILLLSIIISCKFSNINFNQNKLKFILYNIYFIIMFILVWFIKQPYIFSIISVLMIPCFLNWLKNKTLYNFLQKFIVLIICIASLILSIKIWNGFLSTFSLNESEEKTYNNSSLISYTIIRSIGNNYRKIDNVCDIDEIKKYQYLSNSDIKKIGTFIANGKCNSFTLYEVYDTKDDLVDVIVMYSDYDNLSTKEALNFYFINTLKRPLLTLDSYYRSYMSTINIFRKDIYKYYVITGFNLKEYMEGNTLFQNEIRDYGMFIYENKRENTWWGSKTILSEDMYEEYPEIEYMRVFQEESKVSDNTSYILTKLCIIYLILFIVSYLMLPIVLVYSFIKYLKNKKSVKYLIITTLLGVSFSNLIAHVLMGTIIDRYIYPGWILVLLGYIVILIKDNSQKKDL